KSTPPVPPAGGGGRFPAFFPPPAPRVWATTADTISFTTTQVLVNVTVKNARGKYVSTLDRQAFTLLEDDREQEVAEFYGEDAPMAVAVVLDVSGSVVEKDLDRYRNSALDLAYRLKPDDTLALYTFDDKG